MAVWTNGGQPWNLLELVVGKGSFLTEVAQLAEKRLAAART